MPNVFPRTQVENLSLSRMIIGTNWLAGWSHTSPSADRMIQEHHAEPKTIVPILETFQAAGVDTIMAPFDGTPAIHRAVLEAREKTGKDFILVDTPIINVDDSAEGRKEAKAKIHRAKELGASICLLHHSSVEQLLCKRTQTIDRLPDYLSMIRDEGMIPGCTAHMPEVVVYCDQNEYDVGTYVQIYNCMGFLMQVEVETVNQIIHSAAHPVMTIKPMAAGRTTPFVSLNFSWATIRDCDMVTVGCFNEREAAEDIEISMAALEHRRADLARRASPNEKQSAFGKQ